jgi:hypothetical protein
VRHTCASLADIGGANVKVLRAVPPGQIML